MGLDHAYTLTNMEAYALSTHVDVNAGLPWLEVCMPSDPPFHETIRLEERFGINHSAMHLSTTEVYKRSENLYLNGNDAINDHQTDGGRDDEPQTHKFIYPQHLRHHEPLAFSKTGLLRPILDTFTFTSQQCFHRPPIHYSTEELVSFIKQGLFVRQDDAAVDHIELQIDLLSFKLDSYQFKTTIDLIRNVLLEPPKPYRRHLERNFFDQIESKTTTKPSKRIISAAAREMEQALKSNVVSNDNRHRGKKGREMLRAAAMNLLRDIEDRLALDGDAIIRRVMYTLSKLKWCINDPNEIDDVTISFTGFHGQHDYSADGSVTSQFGLEDVRVSSEKPGPDSICFLDPTSVVKSVIGDERSPCQRCGKRFNQSDNDSNSCEFHLGKFESGSWTCCKSDSPGCKSGPHTGKERAANVRVETLPRSVDGITLYRHFEVNIFPGVPHTLVVQIAKSLSRLFMAYFFVEDDGKADLDVMSTIGEVTGPIDTLSTQSDNTPRLPASKSLLIGGKGSPPSVSRQNREEPYLNDKSSEFDNPSELVVSDKVTSLEESSASEIIFIKVWRVGYVNVEVSLGGFRIPQTSLGICVPAYSKAYKIGTWAYLGQKFLTYLIQEVLKSGASSGFDKFRRKVMGNAASPISEQGNLNIGSSASSQTRYTDSSDGSFVDQSSFIGRHLHRSLDAEAILGTPSKKVKPKKKISFAKK